MALGMPSAWGQTPQAAAVSPADAYPPLQVPDPTPYSIVDRTADSRTWERTTYSATPSGAVVSRKTRYVEMATGLHFKRDPQGPWLETSENIDLLPGNAGGAATNGPHQAFFPADLAEGLIDLVTPEGIHLKNRPIGLSYFDGSNSVLIAELTNSVGQIVGALGNQVIYTNIFGSDIVADLLLTYHQSGTECDLIVRSPLPDPGFWGMDAESLRTRVQLLTEFFDVSQPVSAGGVVNLQDGLADSTLAFGSTVMVPGNTFAVGNVAGATTSPVYKSWYQNLEGRTVLVEELPYIRIRAQLDQLASVAGRSTNLLAASLKGRSGVPVSGALRGRGLILPPKRKMAQRPLTAMKMAKAELAERPGLGWDYQTLSGGYTNYLFQADSTYYISGAVTLWGTNTWEGNSVLKFASNASVQLVPIGAPKINFLSSLYRPVVFTAKDDNSIGESFGTGSPLGYYADKALYLGGVGTQSLACARFSYARTAVSLGSATLTASHCQVLHCQSGFSLTGANLNLKNGLLSSVQTNFNAGASMGVVGQEITFDQSSYLVTTPSFSSTTVALTNCVVANVTNLTNTAVYGTVYLSADRNGFYNSPTFGNDPVSAGSSPFQTVDAGSYYLSADSNFRNADTTNLDAALLASLGQRTTYPPLVFSNTAIFADTTFSPQAQRDTDQPDLGYHYDPIDYIVSCQVSNATLLLKNGVVLSYVDDSYGLWLREGSHLVSQGAPSLRNYIVQSALVQEQPLVLGQYGIGSAIPFNPYHSDTSRNPTLNLRFTTLVSPPGAGNAFVSDEANGAFDILTLRDSEVYAAGAPAYFASPLGSQLDLENNLFMDGDLTMVSDGEVAIHNNLFAADPGHSSESLQRRGRYADHRRQRI